MTIATENPPNGRPRELLRDGLVLAGLLLLAGLVYFPAGGHPFLFLDDEAYVHGNAVVRRGLTRDGLAWAFTTFHAGNWHPLAWLSHMADVSLFGVNPGAHHLVNVLLHGANTALLFLFLKLCTRARWRSALVAALFAVHPLHVESVAWIAERKDVLCGFFFLLTLLAYRRYASRPGPGRYVPVLLFLALALLSKPMAVTLPFLLLLLDYWPLRRVVGGAADGDAGIPMATLPRLLAEKAPLLALAAASSVVTVAAQASWGFTQQGLPFSLRVLNAVTSYAGYLEQAVWPVSLAVFYPHPGQAPGGIPLSSVLFSVALLLALSTVAWRCRRSNPPLVVGWLWFLGTMVPVIGILQVGAQAMADRYTYLPLVGIFVMAAWALPEPSGMRPFSRRALAGAGIAAVLALSALSVRQLSYWKSNEALYARALEATERNYFATDGLGTVRMEEGRLGEAEALYREAIRLFPGAQSPHENLGTVLMRQGRSDEGIREYLEALRINPASPLLRLNLATALYLSGKAAEAVPHFEAAIRGNPESAAARSGFGACLGLLGRVDEAAEQFREAIRIDPSGTTARNNLGVLLMQAGKGEEAAAMFRQVLADDPGNEFARRQLGAMGAPAGGG